MNYLTNYYKNLSEQLQDKIDILEKILNEEGRKVRLPKKKEEKGVTPPKFGFTPPTENETKPAPAPAVPGQKPKIAPPLRIDDASDNPEQYEKVDDRATMEVPPTEAPIKLPEMKKPGDSKSRIQDLFKYKNTQAT